MPFLYARGTFAFAGLEKCQAFTDPTISRPRSHITYQPSQAGDEPADHQMGLTAHVLTVQFAKLTIEIDTYSKSF